MDSDKDKNKMRPVITELTDFPPGMSEEWKEVLRIAWRESQMKVAPANQPGGEDWE